MTPQLFEILFSLQSTAADTKSVHEINNEIRGADVSLYIFHATG